MNRNPPENSTRTTSHIDHIDSVSTSNIKSATPSNTLYSIDQCISHPVEDKTELRRTIYQQACLRAANIDPADTHRTGKSTAAIETEFDSQVLDDLSNAFSGTGLLFDIIDHPVDRGYLEALYLKHVRNCSYEALADHLDEHESIRDRLDLNGGVSREAFRRRANKFSDGQPELIADASDRGFFAAYRAGTPIPQSVLENIRGSESIVSILAETDLDELETGEIPEDIRDAGIKQWAELFLDRCLLGQLNFDRDDSTEYPLASFYGLLAHAALQSRSLDEARHTCSGWYTDADLVSSQGAILNQVKRRSIYTLSDQFFDANMEFFKIADEYSAFTDPQKTAFDPTDILWYGEDPDSEWMEDHAYPNKGTPRSSKADKKWNFGVLGIIQPDVQFILGVHPIGKNTNSAVSLANLLRPANVDSPVDINRLIMDRGLSGAPVIRECRYHLGDQWVILGKRERELKDLLEDTPKNQSNFKHLDTYPQGLKNKPNALVLPVDDIEDEEKSHRVFMTDLPEEEIEKEYLTGKYRKRRRIETKIRQLKHDYDIPLADNADTKVKYFYTNIAMLFVNFHNLINNSLSPEYSLPLGAKNYVTSGELLSAIREVAFERAKEQT